MFDIFQKFFVWTLLAGSLVPATVRGAEKEIQFNRDIRPILSDKCMSCHGPDEEHREADLRFDREESAKEDRGGYAAVVAGDPAHSEMWARITTDDSDLIMPPVHAGAKELKPEEKALIKKWIESGAPWAGHWAYEKPIRHPDPTVSQPEWTKNFIDTFILSRLESENLAPAPEADRITLIRRLTFDLTGLPPKPEEVKNFLEDQSPEAYEKVVDRLLASDHYGEQLATYWLDLVRFADTVGYHGDQDHNITPYRDWVLDALNANMPFDDFTRKQLAGDLLPDSTIDDKIASGYNRMLQTTHEGGLQPKEYLAIYAADRVRNVSAVWMGATMGCAQCHTHKYDPYTIKDFYTMASFFADLDEDKHFVVGGNALPTNRPPEIYVLSARERKKFQNLTQQMEKLQAELAQVLAGKIAYRETLDKELAAVQTQLGEIQKSRRKTMISVAIEPRVMRVLPRGNWLDDSGEIVQPAIPEFLGTVSHNGVRANRLDLANWLVDAEQGSGLLTARVFVNRLWYLMFGNGLADLTDFGGQGKTPSHPELLDRLAIEFVESGWNIKQMLKLMVMSSAYRQQSLVSAELLERDPLNDLFARQSRYRLPAEAVRDTLLSISGLLVTDYGGPSAKPYQPTGYYRHLNFPKRKYVAHTDSQQWRRGVYVHWQRQFLHPMLKAFDAPTREECTAERPRSNTPLAALALLNDPSSLEAARAFAVRIIKEGGKKTESRLEFAYQEALSRAPDTTELTVLQETLKAQRELYQQEPQLVDEILTIGLTPLPPKVNHLELAAWTQVARVILNLNETITRN